MLRDFRFTGGKLLGAHLKMSHQKLKTLLPVKVLKRTLPWMASPTVPLQTDTRTIRATLFCMTTK
jgi:hypothetical protein